MKNLSSAKLFSNIILMVIGIWMISACQVLVDQGHNNSLPTEEAIEEVIPKKYSVSYRWDGEETASNLPLYRTSEKGDQPADLALRSDDDYAYIKGAVGLIADGNGAGRSRSLCSGVLIAPNLFLTAAHCFLDFNKLKYKANKGQKRSEYYQKLQNKDGTYFRNWKVFFPREGEFEIERVFVFCIEAETGKPCLYHGTGGAKIGPLLCAEKGLENCFVGNRIKAITLGDAVIVKLKSSARTIRPVFDYGEPIDAALENDICKDSRFMFEDEKSKANTSHVCFIGFGKIPSHHSNNAGLIREKERQIDGEFDLVRVALDAPLKSLEFPIIKLTKATTLENELCPGDSGGPLFQDGQLIGIAVVRYPITLRPYSLERCINRDPEGTFLLSLKSGIVREWVDYLIKHPSLKPDVPELVSAQTIEFGGHFSPTSQFRLAENSEIAHVYSIDLQGLELCRDPFSETALTVSLSAYLGKGFTTLSAGRFAPTDFNLTVIDSDRHVEEGIFLLGKVFGTPYFFWHEKEGRHFLDTIRKETKLENICYDHTLGSISSCKKLMSAENRFCSEPIKVIVERINGHGEYGLYVTVSATRSESFDSEFPLVAVNNVVTLADELAIEIEDIAMSDPVIGKFVWNKVDMVWTGHSFPGNDSIVLLQEEKILGGKIDVNISTSTHVINGVPVPVGEGNLQTMKDRSIEVYLEKYKKDSQTESQWQPMQGDTLDGFPDFRKKDIMNKCISRWPSEAEEEAKQVCGILDSAHITIGDIGLITIDTFDSAPPPMKYEDND